MERKQIQVKKYEQNPETNKLGGGITEEKLNAAVSKSGYPLQTKVSFILKANFHILEEWSFIDDKTKNIRSIDLIAEKWLFDFSEQPRVRPTLNLIIECKQSDLPFVFFLSERQIIPQFPYIAGLLKDEIDITTDNDTSTWHIPITRVLGLEKDNFVKPPPVFCNKFSKGERRGNDLILSGDESFNGIVYPILKAMAHLKYMETPPITAHYFDCHLILGVAVLDAPMVGVEFSKDGHELVSLPWVRVTKHLPDETPSLTHMNNFLAIDVVHKDFLSTYIVEHVLPFSDRTSKLLLKHQEILAENKAFVANMHEVDFFEIESHLHSNKEKKST